VSPYNWALLAIIGIVMGAIMTFAVYQFLGLFTLTLPN
jgi:hypothetical protein